MASVDKGKVKRGGKALKPLCLCTYDILSSPDLIQDRANSK